MKRFAIGMLLLAPLAFHVGCAACCAPYDDAYPTYGGKWQRTDRFYGRVGSDFTPEVGAKVEDAEHVEYVEDGAIEDLGEAVITEESIMEATKNAASKTGRREVIYDNGIAYEGEVIYDGPALEQPK